MKKISEKLNIIKIQKKKKKRKLGEEYRKIRKVNE